MADDDTVTATAELADRVAMLEAFVAAAQITPMAAPPVVIGPFANVPAPGSPIRSDWPQQISQYVVDTRTSVTALQAAVTAIQAWPWATVRYATKSGVFTTDANGAIPWPFDQPFAGLPTIVATGTQQAIALHITPFDISATFCQLLVRNGSGSATVPNASVALAAFAIGAK